MKIIPLRGRRATAVDAGFTLVELVVVIALLGVIGAITSAAFISTQKTFRSSADESQGLQDTQAVIERLGRDIREARGVDPGATASTLVLWVDENSDYIRNSTTQPDEIVSWSLASQGGGSTQYNTLRSTVGGTPVIQSRTLVSALAFCYRATETGPCLTSPLSTADAATVRYVTVSLQYDAVVSGGTATRTATFSERLRNVT